MPQLQESRQAKIWMHALISTHTGVFWEVRNAGCFRSLLSSLCINSTHLAYSEVCSSRSDKRLERGHVWLVLALPIKWRFRKNLQINKPLPPLWLLDLRFPLWKPQRHLCEGKYRAHHHRGDWGIIFTRNVNTAWDRMLASSCAWPAESTNEDKLLPQMAPHRTKKAMNNHTLYEFGHSENWGTHTFSPISGGSQRITAFTEGCFSITLYFVNCVSVA